SAVRHHQTSHQRHSNFRFRFRFAVGGQLQRFHLEHGAMGRWRNLRGNVLHWNRGQGGAGGTYEGTFYNGFGSVTDMMTFLQQNGVKVICWFTPFLNTSSFNDNVNGNNIPGQNTGKSPNYDFARDNGYLVRSSVGGPPLIDLWWKGTGSPIDFTNPAAVNWFKTTQLQPLVDGSKVVTANSSLE